MNPQLFVLVVQPDSGIGRLIVSAVTVSGHHAEMLSAASWAVPVVRRSCPDVVLVESTAHGFDDLLDALDDLEVTVPVLVTQFRKIPPAFRTPDATVIAALVRRAEAAAYRGF